MKIFLSGGTGFIGSHVRQALLEKGHEIRLLVHNRKVSYEGGVEQLEGDITIPATFAGALRGCDVTINLVGIIREFPRRLLTFEKLHLEATRNVVDAAKAAGVKRHIQMSALGTGPNAISRYHQSKFRAEEYVRASGLDWTIFRPSIIFGPEDAFINKLAGMIRSFPVVPVIGDGFYRLQPVSVNDVACCFAMALEMPETFGEIFEVCGPDRLTFNDLLDTIGKVLGKPRVAKLPNPLGLMKVIVPIFQGFSFFPLTMDQLLMLVEENICDGRWQETFHFEPERLAGGIARYLRR
jgi:NADH dehydrogenase